MNIKRLSLLTASFSFLVVGLIVVNQPVKEKYFPRQNTIIQQEQAIANGFQEYMKSIRNNRQTGEISVEEVTKANLVANKMPSGNKAVDLNWRFKGPDNIGGRTRAIVVDINDTAHIIAGGVSGGIWESFDAAKTWAPYDDDFKVNNISCMTQGSDGTIYVGTGARFDGSSNSKGNGSEFVGTGLYKLTGNGSSELLIGPNVDFFYGPAWSTINEIAIDPDDDQRILVAMNTGLQESTDGGTTWSELIRGECYDVKTGTNGRITAAFAGGRLSYSSDGGQNFTEGRIAGASRIELAIAETNSDIQYAAATSGGSNCLLGVFRTRDSWANSELMVFRNADYFNNGISCQGFYDSEIAIFPDNPNRVIVGGITLFIWKQSSVDPAPLEGEWISYASTFDGAGLFRNPSYVHADKHKFVFNPKNPSTLYLGTDGGIGVTFNSKADAPDFSQANLGYNVTQFYDIAVNPNDVVMGGTQDNGTLLMGLDFNTGKSSVEARGGDGFESQLFSINPGLGISALYFGDITRTQGIGNNLAESRINNAGIYSGNLQRFCTGTGNLANFNACAPNVFYTVTAIWESFNHAETRDSVFKDTIAMDEPVLKAGKVIPYLSKNSNGNNKLILYRELENDIQPKNYIVGTYSQKTLTLSDNISELDGFRIGTDSLTFNKTDSSIEFIYFDQSSEVKSYKNGNSVSWNNQYLRDAGSADFTLTITGKTVKYTTAPITFRYQELFPDSVQSMVALTNVATGGDNANRDVWMSRDILKGGDVNEPQWHLIASSQSGGKASKPDALPRNTNTLVAEFSADGDHLFLGTANGSVYRIDNLNDIDVSQIPVSAPTNEVVDSITKCYRIGGFGNVAVTGIALDPKDANNIIVTLGNYGSVRHVFRSTNALVEGVASFDQIDGLASDANSIPDAPAYDALIDREDKDIVFVATELGVFGTSNAFTANPADVEWTEENNGMGRVPAMDLEQMRFTWADGAINNGKIYVGTHGRGVFETSTLVGLKERVKTDAERASKSNELMIYPNPVKETLTVQLTNSLGNSAVIRIYDIKGQMVKEISKQYLNHIDSKLNINLGDLRTGSYVIQLIDGSNSSATRMIKQ